LRRIRVRNTGFTNAVTALSRFPRCGEGQATFLL